MLTNLEKVKCKYAAKILLNPQKLTFFLSTRQLNAYSAISFIHPPLQMPALTFCQRVITPISNGRGEGNTIIVI